LPSGTNAKVDLRIEVTFNETPFANGRPVVTTLRDFAARTQEIIANSIIRARDSAAIRCSGVVRPSTSLRMKARFCVASPIDP